MEPELASLLQQCSKQQLTILLYELAARHPDLSKEIEEIVQKLASGNGFPFLLDGDEPGAEVDEDWDFSGEHSKGNHLPPAPLHLPLDPDAYSLRVMRYAERLQQGEEVQSMFKDLNELLEEAATRAEHRDYHNALDLYALVLDERLAERQPALTALLDSAIDAFMPILETLLNDATSNIVLDTPLVFSPVLNTDTRQQWLERLFAYWLKRLDAHQTEENIPDVLLNFAWIEDAALLRTLVKDELQRQPPPEPSNIVDFTREYRTRALEKFLRDIPLD